MSNNGVKRGKNDDGFRLHGSEGGWTFAEGVPPRPYLTDREKKAINLCAKRRGIKGIGSNPGDTIVQGVRFH